MTKASQDPTIKRPTAHRQSKQANDFLIKDKKRETLQSTYKQCAGGIKWQEPFRGRREKSEKCE